MIDNRACRSSSSWRWVAPLVLALVLGWTQAASAQASAEDLAACQDEERPPAERMAGCNRLIEDAGQVVEIRAEALLNRGQVFEDQNEDQKAIDDYTAAIALNTRYPVLYFQRAGVYERLGQLEPAVADFTEVLALLPDDPASLAARADCLLALRRFEPAILDYTKLIELDPSDADSYVGRALAYESTGAPSKAMADYRQALELDPEQDDALAGLKRLGQSL